ncbi:MAG: DUF58 domain-containing protein [Planctomycetota bacterium]
MIDKNLIKKIQRIEIRTKRLVDDMLAGQYHSAFKGRGVEFEEVRPYQEGDDVRAIDWNVTARTGHPFIKLFREERELTVFLAVDLSASQGLGTNEQTKRELVTEVASTLAFSAIRNNDKVGLMLFTDGIEKLVPARKGSRHVLRCVRELLHCHPMGTGTDLDAAMHHLNRVVKRRAVVFLISDFQDSGYASALQLASRKHDVIPVVINDQREYRMPNVGMIELRDSETGSIVSLDTSSRAHRQLYAQAAARRAAERNETFQDLKLEPIQLYTGEEYVEPIRGFFHRRMKRG